MDLPRDISPEAQAYLALRDDAATYVGTRVLPGDIFFRVILPYLEPPYRAFVPTTGPLSLGASHHLASINTGFQNHGSYVMHSPLAAINQRGEFIIPRRGPNFSDTGTFVIQLHDRHQPRYETSGRWVDVMEVTMAHYTIAFSATHVAVCSMVGLRHSDIRAYRIRIWRTDAGANEECCAFVEHIMPRQRSSYANEESCPIISNGSGTLYITQFSTDYYERAVIFRYRLNERGQFVSDAFTCGTSHVVAVCASGNFLCVAANDTYTYSLPQELVEGRVAELHRYRQLELRSGINLPDDRRGHRFMNFQHVCLDAEGSLFVLEDTRDCMWSMQRIDGRTGAVTDLGSVDRPDEYRARGEGDFCAARPLLHPSGRIFVIWCREEWENLTSKRIIEAQELVKQ